MLISIHPLGLFGSGLAVVGEYKRRRGFKMHSHNNGSPHGARLKQDITVVCGMLTVQFMSNFNMGFIHAAMNSSHF